MTNEERIQANADKGYILVAEFDGWEIHKKLNEAGGWTYYSDHVSNEGAFVIWDTACSTTEELQAILTDIQKPTKESKTLPLSETEQKIIALALFGYVMRAGPGQFARTIEIANKIGVEHELTKYALNWIAEPKDGQQPKDPLDTSAQATVKFAILNGILTQWHQEQRADFPNKLMESVYRELFEGIYYKNAIRTLVELPEKPVD